MTKTIWATSCELRRSSQVSRRVNLSTNNDFFVYGITIKQSFILLNIIDGCCAGLCCKYFLIKSRCRGKSCEWGMTPSITTQPPAASLMIATSLWPHLYHLSRIPPPAAIVYLISALWPALDLWHSASVVRRGAWRVRSVTSTHHHLVTQSSSSHLRHHTTGTLLYPS